MIINIYIYIYILIITKKAIGLFLIIFEIVFLIFSVPAFSQTNGAELFLSSSEGSHKVGDKVAVFVKLSAGRSVNAIEGRLNFTKDKVEIIDISKTESIIDLWAEGPSFSNSQGVIKFSGGIQKPGFIGTDGELFKIVFNIKAVGPATIVWNYGQVLAADGTGANVLSNTKNVDFNFYPTDFFNKIEQFVKVSGVNATTMALSHFTIIVLTSIMIAVNLFLPKKIIKIIKNKPNLK